MLLDWRAGLQFRRDPPPAPSAANPPRCAPMQARPSIRSAQNDGIAGTPERGASCPTPRLAAESTMTTMYDAGRGSVRTIAPGNAEALLPLYPEGDQGPFAFWPAAASALVGVFRSSTSRTPATHWAKFALPREGASNVGRRAYVPRCRRGCRDRLVHVGSPSICTVVRSLEISAGASGAVSVVAGEEESEGGAGKSHDRGEHQAELSERLVVKFRPATCNEG